MLITDDGGYAGTDWRTKDVRFMWSTIANHDTDAHFDVVQGWSRTADLTLAHLGQVRKYRENLASVWPPTKSAAAAAYLERLDKLLADLQATHDAASANYTAFSTVTVTLSQARTKLKPIIEQYEANEQLNLDWQAKQKAVANDPARTPTLAIPPVSATRQEQLNYKARVVMYDLSNTILSAQKTLQKPKPYDPIGGAGQGEDKKKGNAGSLGFAVPPMIPAPGSGNGSSEAVSTLAPISNTQANPPNPLQPTPIVPVGNVGTGPVLGGVGPTLPANPPISGAPPTPAPTMPGSTPGLITSPSIPGLLPSGGLPPSVGRPPTGGQLMPDAMPGPTSRATMPSGGVIGATPGSGIIGQVPSGVPGRSRPGSTARVNPVGGVIGQPSSSYLGNPTAKARGRRAGAIDPDRWDPDQPWITEDGVDPVVLPPKDPGPIDPGPAIGYTR
jgi:hypothetical protein